MKSLYIIAIAALMSFVAMSCTSSRSSAYDDYVAADTSSVVPESPSAPRPMREPAARAFRVNGPYLNNVMVILSDDGSEVVERPLINQVDASSAPIALADGWWLDVAAVDGSAAFLDWTYYQYSQLPATPSDEEILAHVIPGACITEIVELPLSRYYARRNPAVCDDMILHNPSAMIPLFKR